MMTIVVSCNNTIANSFAYVSSRYQRNILFDASKKTSKIYSEDPNLKQLEKSVSDKIGLRVFIKNKKNNTGSVLFEYKDLDQLNKLIDAIKLNY